VDLAGGPGRPREVKYERHLHNLGHAASVEALFVGLLPAVAGGLEQPMLAQGQAHLTCPGVEPVLAPAGLGTSAGSPVLSGESATFVTGGPARPHAPRTRHTSNRRC
jgi:hypothetical protein